MPTDFDFLIERLSTRQDRRGIMDAICCLLWAAEMEDAEAMLEAALQHIRQERQAHQRWWLEWTEEGWREIRS